MSTAQIWQINSTSLEDTLHIAATLGRKFKGDEVLVLVSDLGGGKTAFVKGLAKGMGSAEQVHSPTFTVSNQYSAGKLTLHHFDFYRLQDPGVLREELAEVVNDPLAVVAIEWAEIVEDVLPENRITLAITPTGENSRELTFTYTETYAYVFN
ncbi:MAG: tRNA (adenosine(37)-N6)-threonylcarbamoyltransferase complex ATPase subunit type 1 TsaE [Patescibacteria group bacterium]|nr:tRNA (adenosine(37)-N6)-threonylcarbamoyltransferase complex ATPase subunit type 1 TsaE [Patescibacteria group bacterium]